MAIKVGSTLKSMGSHAKILTLWLYSLACTIVFLFCSHFASYDDKENILDIENQEVM